MHWIKALRLKLPLATGALVACGSVADTPQQVELLPVEVHQLGVLPRMCSESSGMGWKHNRVWTHNDSGGAPEFVAISPDSMRVTAKIKLTNGANTDWEDMACSNQFLYLADVGNNMGNRKQYQLYRVPWNDIQPDGKFQLIKSTVIPFSYEDQPRLLFPYNHNYDCEAVACVGNDILLFTKNWGNQQTDLYKLAPGDSVARKLTAVPCGGLITGADYDAPTDRMVLCGYTFQLRVFDPFLIVFEQFSTHRYRFRKYALQLAHHQIEGVAVSGDTIYLTSEESSDTDQRLYPASLFKLVLP